MKISSFGKVSEKNESVRNLAVTFPKAISCPNRSTHLILSVADPYWLMSQGGIDRKDGHSDKMQTIPAHRNPLPLGKQFADVGLRPRERPYCKTHLLLNVLLVSDAVSMCHFYANRQGREKYGCLCLEF